MLCRFAACNLRQRHAGASSEGDETTGGRRLAQPADWLATVWVALSATSHRRGRAVGRRLRAPYAGLMRRSLIGVLLVLGLTGCGAVASTQTSTAPPQPAASTTATTSHHAVARRRRAPAHRSRPHPASKPATAPGGLVVSAASAHQVQPQPAPGSCHAIGHGEIVKPDPRCTPGATSPAVTQATIN